MGGSTTISTSETRIEALKLQSSAYGVTIPMVWGMTRIPGNLVWYGAFRAIANTTTTSSGGKGGGVKTQNTTYTYTASLVLALCQGVIASIPRVWRGKRLYSGGITPSQLLTVIENYTPPGSGAMTYTVTQAATFRSVSYIRYQLDPSNITTLSRGLDYTVSSAGVVTVLRNIWRGRQLRITYQYTSGSVSQSALTELGLSLVPGNLGQATWSYLTTNFSAQAIGYSGLAILTGQDYDLGTGAQVENHNFEVVGPQAYSVGTSTPDVDPSVFLLEALTNARSGAAFPVEQLDAWTTWSDYCVAAGLLISPALVQQIKAADVIEAAGRMTATAPVWSGDRLKMVPYADTSESGNGRGFTPNTTPVYDLTDDHYVPEPGEPPVVVNRKSPADLFNHVRVEFWNRANQYNVETAEAKDQADIDANGLRTMETLVAHWICEAAVARKVAQILLQRSLFVAARYTFRLPVNFNLLEPGDLVTLNDPGLGLNLTPVRVTRVDEEGDDGAMTVEAEDYPAGTASSALYPSQAGTGYQADYNAAPGAVSTPLIFEAPGELTANGLEVWIAVRGVGANWGGCRVWVSLDGSNYRQIGVSYGGARYGTLTGAISGGNLPVALLGGQLLNGSAADAAALNTLCYVGGSSPEFLAYQTATLTGTLAYTLSGLVRGAYSSVGSAAHSTGDGFARLDEAIVKSGIIDMAYIGRTISFKFTSFNPYGGAEESLASVAAYSYTVKGSWVYGNSGVSAANSVFTTRYATEFRNTADGWVATNASLTVNPDSVTVTASAGDPQFYRSSGLSIDGSVFDLVRARVRRLAGTGWDGSVFYVTGGHGFSSSFGKQIPAPPPSGWVVLEWDMRNLSAGGTDWITSTITGLRLDLGLTSADVFEVDWVAVGKDSVVSLGDLGYTGDLNATADVTLIASSGMTVSGNTATKSGGTSGWNQQVYSQQAHVGGAFAGATVPALAEMMFGLNADPATDANYTSIDYAFYIRVGGGLEAYESGSQTQVFGGGVAAGDDLAVTYDGATVRWLKNGAVLRSVAVAAGLTLRLDTSFDTVGSQLRALRYVPLSPVTNIGTGQLQNNAATEILTATYVAGPVTFSTII